MTTAILIFILTLLYPGPKAGSIGKTILEFDTLHACKDAQAEWATIPEFQVSGCRAVHRPATEDERISA